MPRLIHSSHPIKKKKNRYQLSHETKCKIYWRRFKTFPSFKEAYYKWCLLSVSLSRQSRLTLNGLSVERLCKDVIGFQHLISLSNNDIVVYENSCISNPKRKYVHYIKVIVPSDSYPSIAKMFDWFLGVYNSLSDDTKIEHHLLFDDPLSIPKPFVGIQKQVKFVFINSNFFKPKKWGHFLKTLCFCSQLYFEINTKSDVDLKKTKTIAQKYNMFFKARNSEYSKYLSRFFESLVPFNKA